MAEIEEIKRYSCIDYELLESKYEILHYDICTKPNYEWKDRKLEKFVLESYADILEQEKQLIETGTSEGDIVPTTFDYHIFDFNDDGLDDFPAEAQSAGLQLPFPLAEHRPLGLQSGQA